MIRLRFEESIKDTVDKVYRMNILLQDKVNKQEARILELEQIIKRFVSESESCKIDSFQSILKESE